MGVIGDTVLRLVAEAVALGVVFALSAGAACLLALRVPPLRHRPGVTFGAAAAGAMIAAAAADRLGAPAFWEVTVGRRSVPLVWAMAGALAGMAAGLWAGSPRRTAAAGSADSRGGGAAPPQPDTRRSP